MSDAYRSHASNNVVRMGLDPSKWSSNQFENDVEPMIK